MLTFNKPASPLGFFGLLAIMGLITACGTPQVVTNQNEITQSNTSELKQSNTLEIDNGTTGVTDLTVYLKQISGVQINGSGADAQITVRGISSVNMEASPLFVINGNPIGKDYATVYNMVDIQQVKQVRVLKNSVDTSMYGMRGATGVVEIELK